MPRFSFFETIISSFAWLRLLTFVHYILRFVIEKRFNVVDADVDEALPRFLCGPGDVWGEKGVFSRE